MTTGIMNEYKIFVIGFNKCGTTSLHHFFDANGIKSIHWHRGRISEKIFDNYLLGKPLIQGYEDYDAFSDIEHFDPKLGFRNAGHAFFRKLAIHDESAVFILNFRDKEAWLQSRLNHGIYLLRTLLSMRASDPEVAIQAWSEYFDRHIARVQRFFEREKERLCTLKIDEPNANSKLVQFVETLGVRCQERIIPKAHKTKKENGNCSEDWYRYEACLKKEQESIESAMTLLSALKTQDRQLSRMINKRMRLYRAVIDSAS